MQARQPSYPAYLELEQRGELARREEAAWRIMTACRLCPRRCGVDRSTGERGVCKAGTIAEVASAGPHFGEESPLVGSSGSGTVFFAHCNLLCVFCQNHDIAHGGRGTAVSHRELAEIMLELQHRGCHNINLVTPTHVVPQIISALRLAAGMGLRLPLVYNTGGYESLEVLELLDGIVDIYLPDFKYQDPDVAARLSADARDYPEVAATAIRKMHRQVGVLDTDSRGIARRGLLIRHLVLPADLAGTGRFVRWVASEITPNTHINLMDQYRPEHLARDHPELAVRPSRAELEQALCLARAAGLSNLI